MSSRIIGVIGGDTPNLLRLLTERAEHAQAQTARLGRATLVASGQELPLAVHAEERVVAVLDGAIYNRGDLSNSEMSGPPDVALLVSLYRQHGFEEALRRVNGDFAVALYDAARDELWLGRDRFGVKPLFYARGSDWLGFASRPRALLALPGISGAVRPRFLAVFAGSHYRTFDNEPGESPYQDVAQLPAAHLLRLRDGQVTVRPYWSLQEAPNFTDPPAILAERYRDLILDAVKIRLPGASRPVFTLSGGMDSSTVIASAAKVSGQRMPAASTIYKDPTYDESKDIETIVPDAVSTWHRVMVDEPDLVGTIDRMVAANDEPVATATWLSHYLLCEELAKLGYSTMFGGLGGDELNAGEYEYFFYMFADLAAAEDEEALRHETSKWIEHHDHPIFKKTFAVMRQGLERLVDLGVPGRCLPDRARLSRYQDTVNPELFDLAGYVPVMDHPFSSYLKNRRHQDIFRETSPCCLRAADRHATAFGMDVRWPFFDHRLAELMFRVSSRLQIRDGVTKHLLREATKGIVPEETRTRIKKTGWNAPAHLWFSGPGRELLLDIVGSQAFRERGIYNLSRVRQIIDAHDEIVRSGRAEDNHMMFLWQLLTLDRWLTALSPPSPKKR
jgi:asparagine synthase (glutamine-hydrolysing)